MLRPLGLRGFATFRSLAVKSFISLAHIAPLTALRPGLLGIRSVLDGHGRSRDVKNRNRARLICLATSISRGNLGLPEHLVWVVHTRCSQNQSCVLELGRVLKYTESRIIFWTIF